MKKMTEQKIEAGNAVFRILVFLPQISAKPPVLLLGEVIDSNYQAANMNRKATTTKSTAFLDSVY